MLAEISTLLCGLAALCAAYGMVAALLAAASKDSATPGGAHWAESARRAGRATALLAAVAWGGLLIALLADRFEVYYVAAHSSRALPWWLKVSAVWGGQEGSLLTWALLQAGVAALAARGARDRFGLWVLAILDALALFFLAATLFLSNPFAQSLSLPADGAGLNPLLRHPAMALHPPALFLGYVALAVPLALAVAGIVTGEQARWRAAARPWTLAAWFFLGLGLLLGARWAYDVLGWGGYWAWDPVENAALMPWLTATALLHLLMRGGRESAARGWGGALAALSFVLVIFGTYATRSGDIVSVHAYARSDLGAYLLILMALVALTPLAAAALTRKTAVANGVEAQEAAAPSSTWRGQALDLTAILLVMLAVSIWIGTALPALSGWLAGQRIEAGPEWFDRVTGPQFALLVLVMGVCPLLGAAVAGRKRLRRHGPWLLTGGIVVAGAVAWAGWRSAPGLIGAFVAGVAASAVLSQWVADILCARGKKAGAAPLNALAAAVAAEVTVHRRRYGGTLVHLGVACMALGIIGTRLFPLETTLTLAPSVPQTVGRYELVFDELRHVEGDDYSGQQAAVSLYAGDRYLTTLYPELRTYSGQAGAAAQTLARPAMRVGWREDVYVALTAVPATGAAGGITVQVALNRLVNWLWLGGLLLLAGGVLAWWPAQRAGGRAGRTLRIAAACVVILALLAAVWALWGPGHGASRGVGGRPLVGTEAPAFRATLLAGGTIDGADLRGQVVVLNFWASWCPSCESALPAMERVWQDYEGRGVAMVGIATGDEVTAAQAATQAFGLTYTLALDSDGATVAQGYGITGVPETFVMGRDGRVAYVHVGVADEAVLRGELDALLAGE